MRRAYGLRPRYDRLREAGLLTVTEVADQLGITPVTARQWLGAGLLGGAVCNDKNEHLYYPPVP